VRSLGDEAARATGEVLAAIAAADAIVIAPSNPIVSIGPILAVPGIEDELRAARDRGVAVLAMSGIIGGRALKGPADRMLASLGHEATAVGVARMYRAVATSFIVDQADVELVDEIELLRMQAFAMDTIMSDDSARTRIAGACLDLLRSMVG
jgi:LPPG:FO 2-phospho-L-lactate transferase